MSRLRARLRAAGTGRSRALNLAHRRDVRLAVTAGTGAVVALVVGSGFGDLHAHDLRTKLVAVGAAVVLVVLGVVAVRSAAQALFGLVSLRSGRGGATALRIATLLAGYAVVGLCTLAVLAVPVQHLLLGGAITGVVLGIAAQQSLGNLFAGLVLLLAHPFSVGDRIRIRAGALGGELQGTVVTVSLTYVVIDADDGRLHIPNASVLAAAVGPRPRNDTPITTVVLGPPAAARTAASPTGYRRRRAAARRS